MNFCRKERNRISTGFPVLSNTVTDLDILLDKWKSNQSRWFYPFCEKNEYNLSHYSENYNWKTESRAKAKEFFQPFFYICWLLSRFLQQEKWYFCVITYWEEGVLVIYISIWRCSFCKHIICRIVQKAKICHIFRFRTFLESWDDSKSKLFHTFFSILPPKENTVISSISLWR